MVLSLEPRDDVPGKSTPTIGYAAVRIGPITVRRVALLRRSGGTIVTGMPRRMGDTGWEPLITLDDETAHAVLAAVRAAYADMVAA